MYFSAKSAAFLCLCFLAVPPAFGQDGHSCLQRTVIANVVDDRGITPADLTRENFKITYKGQTANPLNVAYTKGPRRVMVLLDVSGSMSSQGTGKCSGCGLGACGFAATRFKSRPDDVLGKD